MRLESILLSEVSQKLNGKEHMMNQLGHMMHDADDEERKILEKCMHDLNRA